MSDQEIIEWLVFNKYGFLIESNNNYIEFIIKYILRIFKNSFSS